MSLATLIAGTRKAIAEDAAKAHVMFSAQGTLVGVTEVDIKTGAHSFKVDEPRALGGAGAAANLGQGASGQNSCIHWPSARSRASSPGWMAAPHRAQTRPATCSSLSSQSDPASSS
jgi:hypothetical protein